MSRSHRRLLVASAVIATLMLLFPPFEIRLDTATLNMGYGFLLNPPDQGRVTASVNLGLLLAQWGVLAIICVAGWFTITPIIDSESPEPATTPASSNATSRSDRPAASNIPTESGSETQSRDIQGWHLALGLIALFVAIAVLRGPPVSESDLKGSTFILADHLGFFVALPLVGLLVAAIGEGIARAGKRPRTALRRNVLIAAWVAGGLALVGTFAERDRQTEPTPAETGVAVVPHRPAFDEPARNSQPSPEFAAPVEPTSNVVNEARPTPWNRIVRKREYLEGTRAQRDAIRDLYWDVCIAVLVEPGQQASGEQAFRADAAEVEVGLPPPAPAAMTGTMSVWEYLEQKRRAERQAVSAETVRVWCRRGQ